MEQEVWKDINGYEGLYQISNLGRVKSLDREKWNGKGFELLKEKIIKPFIDKKSYLGIGLSKNGKKKNYRLHRLIAEHFITNPENKPTIDHIDRNISNNSLDNLRWATDKEQCDNKKIRKDASIILDINTGVYYYSLNDAAFFNDIKKSTLLQYLTNKRKNKKKNLILL
jgi:hypothetical protein